MARVVPGQVTLCALQRRVLTAVSLLSLCGACCFPFPDASEDPAPFTVEPAPAATPDVISYEELEVLSTAVSAACPDGCAALGTCPGPWCVNPVGHPVRLSCSDSAHCYVAFTTGAPGFVRVLLLSDDPRVRETFDPALDRAMRAAAPVRGTPQDASLLMDVDEMCGDLWCEGVYDYRFDAISCDPAGACVVAIRGIDYDEYDQPRETSGRLELPPGTAALLRSGEPPEQVQELWSAALDGWSLAQER